MKPSKPLIAILGPTAVGKTNLSLELASRLDGEIVSADSRLLYRGMDIGTDKPSLAARARVPHHLIDVADPQEAWSMARFRQAALQAIDGIQARGRLPFLVGGTGQYMAAVLEGWNPPPRSDSKAFRERMQDLARRQGIQALHARLAEVDPELADEIDPRNIRRVIRALEVHQLTGQPASRLRKRKPPPYEVLRILLELPRQELYARIDRRIEAMMAAGWLDEVRRLLARGASADSPAFSAIGYRQLAEHLRGERSLDDALAEIRKLSRQLVRRQSNWLRRLGEGAVRIEARGDFVEPAGRAIRAWLEGKPPQAPSAST